MRCFRGGPLIDDEPTRVVIAVFDFEHALLHQPPKKDLARQCCEGSLTEHRGRGLRRLIGANRLKSATEDFISNRPAYRKPAFAEVTQEIVAAQGSRRPRMRAFAHKLPDLYLTRHRREIAQSDLRERARRRAQYQRSDEHRFRRLANVNDARQRRSQVTRFWSFHVA